MMMTRPITCTLHLCTCTQSKDTLEVVRRIPTCYDSDAIVVLLSIKGEWLRGRSIGAQVYYGGVNVVLRQLGTFLFANSLVELDQFGLVRL